MTTVDRIFQIMDENNLNAKGFAKIVGLSPGNITDWKTGRANPSLSSLQKISHKFNVDVEWLIGNSDKKEAINFNLLLIPDDFEDIYLHGFSSYLIYVVKIIAYLLLFEMPPDDKVDKYISDDMKDYQIPLGYATRVHLAILHLYDYNKLFNKRLKKLQKGIKDYKSPTTKQISYYMCPVYGQISAGQPNWVEENIEGRLPLDTDLMGIVNPEEHFFLRVNGESMNKVIKNGAFALIHKQDYINNGEIAVVLVNGYDATLKKFTKQGNFVILEPQSTDDSFETQIYDKKTSIKILGKYIGKMEINK